MLELEDFGHCLVWGAEASETIAKDRDTMRIVELASRKYSAKEVIPGSLLAMRGWLSKKWPETKERRGKPEEKMRIGS